MRETPEDVIGTVRDAVITAWHKRQLPGRRGLGTGFAKLLDADGTSTDIGLYVRENEIVTTGIDTLKPGSHIQCFIGPPDEGYTTLTALSIEVYADCMDELEDEPSAQENGNELLAGS